MVSICAVDFIKCGRLIKAQRISRSMTQKQLGDLVGVNEAHISRIERGTAPSLQVLVIIYHILGLSLDSLVYPERKSEGRILAEATLAKLKEDKLHLANEILRAISQME